MTRGTFVLVATFGVVAPASAGDLPLFNQGLKIYPKSEARYIKQYTAPSISPCGPCFGYYKTQWRSWGEACNEPQAADPGPTKYAPPPEDAIPEPEKKGTPAVPKLDAGPKDPEKKDPPVMPPDKKNPSLPMDDKKPEAPKPDEKKPEIPKIDLPKLDVPEKKLLREEPRAETASAIVPGSIDIAIPAVPVASAPLPVPTVAPAPLPTVIVPISR